MKKLFCLAALFLASFGVVGPSFAQTGTVVATVRPNPLQIVVSAPGSVQVGQWFEITATVSNLGTETITKTTVIINPPFGMSVKGSKTKKIGNLTATQTVSWRAKAANSGNFIIQVEATGILAGEEISDSDSSLIQATGSLGAFLKRLIFGA